MMNEYPVNQERDQTKMKPSMIINAVSNHINYALTNQEVNNIYRLLEMEKKNPIPLSIPITHNSFPHQPISLILVITTIYSTLLFQTLMT